MPVQQPQPIQEQQDSYEQKDVSATAGCNAGRRPPPRTKPSRPDKKQAEKERDHRIVKNTKKSVRQGSSSFPTSGSAAA
jgi:hypothetical protein